MSNTWFAINNPDTVSSPALLVFPERIRYNIQEMLRIAGKPERLRPHIKTYKMAEIIRMQMDFGINKFKCATIAEAELLAKTGANDILLAMQPVGPNVIRYFELAKHYSQLSFSCLVDNQEALDHIGFMASETQYEMGVFMDINNGMNRTGIAPGEEALTLYQNISKTAYLQTKGLHVYDGHLRLPGFEERKEACEKAFAPVIRLKEALKKKGLKVDSIVVGGSPTFPVHALRDDAVLSPGTTLLWDEGYGSKFQDMPFKHAAVLLTRLISKPKLDQFCLDLGHKSIASEMPFPRLKFLNTDDFEQLGQSEEHLVVKAKNPDTYKIGDVFYAVPMHICPTVAKYPKVKVVENETVIGEWSVAARDHKINF